MIGLHARHKYYLYSQPVDMRKSFDGLSGLVRNHLVRNPTDGEVYVFLNRDRSIIKLLQWDRSGFSIYSKRLERGSFESPLAPRFHLVRILCGFHPRVNCGIVAHPEPTIRMFHNVLYGRSVHYIPLNRHGDLRSRSCIARCRRRQ